MAPEPVVLAPLGVEVRASWLVDTGFYYRRSKDFGYFLTPERLRRRNVPSVLGVLKTVPGVRVGRLCQPGGRLCRQGVLMSRASGTCRTTYYMDGTEMTGNVAPRDINVQDLAAIEVYRGISETPPQFYGRCGSVVMWSRRHSANGS